MHNTRQHICVIVATHLGAELLEGQIESLPHLPLSLLVVQFVRVVARATSPLQIQRRLDHLVCCKRG
jgi:hypothetical protein